MSTRQTKLVCSIRVEESTSLWVTEWGGVAVVPADEIVIAAGLYYISDDAASDDLIEEINAAFIASGYDVRFGITGSDGIVSHQVGSGGTTAKLHWGDPDGNGRSALDIQAALRLDDNSNPYLLTHTLVYGYRVALGLFYPTSYLQADRDAYIPRASVFNPDSGNAQVLKIARRKEYNLRIRSTGYPRITGYSEYHEFQSWHDEATSGRPFRLYSDRSVTTAYSAPSNRWGYETMTIDPQPLDWQPEQGNWYKHFQYDIKAYDYS